MRFVAATVALLAVLAPASTTAGAARSGSALWSGGFENGVAPWTGVQAKDGGFQIVSAPGRSGAAARFLVRPGDVPIGSSGERAEVYKQTGEEAGVESFWRWSVYFPPGSQTSPDTSWNVFTQWHQAVSGGVQPLSFEIMNQRGREWFQVRSWGGNASSPTRRSWRVGPMIRGKWYDFAAQIRWAADSNGSLEVWLDGKPVIRAPRTPTLYAGESVYLKQGFYRASSGVTSEVYIAGTRRAESLAALGITEAPAPSLPAAERPPVVVGALQPGRVLTTSLGRWLETPTKISFRWLSTRDGSTWSTFGSARRSIVLPARFAASAVRVRVIASNRFGSTTLLSAPLERAGRPVAAGKRAPDPVIVQSIKRGQTLRGVVVWKVVPTAAVQQVVFAMDSNAVTHADTSPPYEYVVDTRRLADGEHTFGLTVTMRDGRVVWKPYQIGTVVVDNRGGS
jgi:hypothetical protein